MVLHMGNLRNWVYRNLRQSEGLFKIDMVYLAKGGFWQTFGQIINNLLSFVLIIFFANFLSKETYGLYKYVISLGSILGIFALTGMNQAVNQAAANGHDDTLRTSVIYQLKWNVIVFLAFWLTGGYYFVNDNMLMASSFFILGVFSPLTLALNTYGAYLEGKKVFRLSNFFNVISTFVYVLGMITVVLLGKDLVWLIAAYSLTTFSSNLFFYILTIRMFRVKAGPADHVLKYGRDLTFIGLINPITSQVDSIILNHFWGPAQLAVYSLAMAIPNRAISFTKSWVNLGFPKLSTKTIEEADQAFYRRIIQGLSLGLIMTIAYVVIAPYFFKLLLPAYLDSVFYSQILMVSLIFAMPNRYISILFSAQKLTRLILVNSIAQSIIRILLYLSLGIWGGIFGLVLAQVLNSLISLLINTSLWRLKVRRETLRLSTP